MRKTTTIKLCGICKIEMYMPKWKTKRTKFCSRKCYGLERTRSSAIKNGRDCLECGKSFIMASVSQGKYCSYSCYWESFRIEKPDCKDCGVGLQVKSTIRCRECWSKSILGENHPMWISDRLKVKRYDERGDPAYQAWRRDVLRRDKYRCRACGEDDKREIQADHIYRWAKYPRLRYMIENGQALCRTCHKQKTAMEMRGVQVASIY